MSGSKALSLVLIAAAAALFVFSVAHSIDKPFSLDETDLALRAHLINRQGPFPPGFVTGGAEALTHPPLYEFTLAFVFRIAGETERAARGFGVLCYLLTGFLTCLSLRHLLASDSRARSWGTAVLLLLLLCNPLMIQHAMLIDADTTGTALCVSLFFFVFLKCEKLSGPAFLASRLGLAAVIAAMFLFKEAIPVLVMGGVAVWRLLNRDWRRLAADLMLILGAGALTAWAVWTAYAHALGMDPLRIHVSQGGQRYSRMSPAFVGKVIKSLPVITRWPVYWNSAPLAALFACAAGLRIVRFLRLRRLGALDVLVLGALAVWIPFYLFKPSIDMMKYQYPAYPLLLAALAVLLAERFARFTIKRPALWIAAAGTLFACAFVHYYGLGDYITLLFTRADRPAWKEFVVRYYAPLAVLTAAALAAGATKRSAFAACLAVWLFVTFPVQAALNFRQTAGYTTVESWMNYGEKGLDETIGFLETRVRPGIVTVVRKDIRYYLERRNGIALARNLDPGTIFKTPERQMEELERFLKNEGPDFLVTDPISLFRIPTAQIQRVGVVLLKHYEPAQTFGGFRIYRKKGPETKRAEISGPERP